MNQIIYRKATIEDINTLVDLRIRFALELKGGQSEENIMNLRQQLTGYFTKAMGDDSCISYMALVDDEIAGIGSMMIREQAGNFKNPTGRWAYIMNMYTIPSCRRKGICKGILQALVDEGNRLSIGAFELHATPSGESVYSQNGFSLHPEPTLRKYMHT